jgi:hypothetical protein
MPTSFRLFVSRGPRCLNVATTTQHTHTHTHTHTRARVFSLSTTYSTALRVITFSGEYSFFMSLEASRREKHAASLSERYRALLPSGILERKSSLLRASIATNQEFLNAVADEQELRGFGLQFREPCGSAHPSAHRADGACCRDQAVAPTPSAEDMPVYFPRRSAANHSKVRSTLHQLVRDWSAEGAAEREICYGSVLRELTRVLPITAASANRLRVLVPGCGLGRLVFDLARAGYAAQGNEFSYQMLFTSQLILNATDTAEKWAIHPFIHDPSNHLRPEDMLREMRVPDVAPGELTERNPGADMSIAAGDFTEVYSTPAQEGAW